MAPLATMDSPPWRPAAVVARRRQSRKPRASPCGVPLIDATNHSPPRVRIDEHAHDGGDCVSVMCDAPAALVAVLSSFGLADEEPAAWPTESGAARASARASAPRAPHASARVAQRAIRAWLRRRAVGRRR